MRIFLPALGLSAFGLPLLFLACTPKVRPDFVGSGGAGGAASATTSDGVSATGPGSGGSGGSGGAAPMGTCKTAGQAFTILGDTELDGTPKLDDKLYLIPDMGKRAMVHVVVADNGMNRVLVRTIVDDPLPLGNYAQYGAVGSPSFRPGGAHVAAGQLFLRGIYANSVAQLAYTIDPDKGVGADGMLQTLPTPIQCQQGGHPNKVVFAPGSSPPKYLLTCLSDTAGDPATLFAGDGSAMPAALVTKDPSSPEMQPGLYTYEDNTHLVIFGGDGNGSFFSHGSLADLGTLQPLKLTPDAVTLNGVFATVPLPADKGITLIGAFFDTNAGKGQFLTGPILASDYGSLAKIPPAGLSTAQQITNIADVAPIFFPTWDANGIFGGGASTDGATARLYWFTRTGKPRVFGQIIYSSPGPTILTANAAPLGDLNQIMVWTERDDAASPPKYTVKGQKLICQIKS